MEFFARLHIAKWFQYQHSENCCPDKVSYRISVSIGNLSAARMDVDESQFVQLFQPLIHFLPGIETLPDQMSATNCEPLSKLIFLILVNE